LRDFRDSPPKNEKGHEGNVPLLAGGEANLVKTLTTSRDVFMSVVDSLDACVLTVNLEGTVLAANKAVVDLVKAQFDQIVGSALTGLMSQPSAEEMQEGLKRFREKRHWDGVIEVYVTARQRWYFFDCTFYPVIKRIR
jgi:nitrogen fixation/metabolism regulation signal transduction histidine kinase